MDENKEYEKTQAVARALMRRFSIQEEKKPKYRISEKRQWMRSINEILRIHHFPPKQKKLLLSIAENKSIDSYGIKSATGTKDSKALVRDTKKTINSHEQLKNFLTIGSFRKGNRWFYYLKLKSTNNN